jgi:hypothetical protein
MAMPPARHVDPIASYVKLVLKVQGTEMEFLQQL